MATRAIGWAFAGAWAIWLGGYAAMLAVDYALRAADGYIGSGGVAASVVPFVAVVFAGAASGYFLAATGPWPMRRRIGVLLLQVPAAYMAAVGLGIVYLCAAGIHCP